MIEAFRLEFSGAASRRAIEHISQSIRSGRIATGEGIERLETGLAALTGAQHVAAVSSGSAGLELAMLWVRSMCGHLSRPNVVLPTNTFMATLECARRLGFEIKLADMDPETLGLDLRAVSTLIDGETAAVIPVHIGGIVDPALAIFCRQLKANGVRVIEDAAHSLGSDPALSGDAAVTSFYATKVFTGGEGGAILTDDPELDEFARRQRNFGKPSPWVSHHEHRGWNYRMQEFAAHLVSEQLADADEILETRRQIAMAYVERLGDRIVGHEPPWPRRSWYKVLYRTTRPASAVKNALHGVVGFPGGVYDTPLHRQPAYAQEFGDLDFPVADHWARHHLALPVYPSLSTADVDAVCAGVREADRG